MKLKYYMRGLGIGIILATLILTIGGRKESLSDQEIINKAIELGMVTKEDYDKATIMNDNKPTVTVSPTQKPAVDKAATLTPTLKPTMSPVPTIKAVKKSKQKAQKKVTFTIKKGMSSIKVAKLLKEKGLIDDPKKFNNYIVKQGKQNVINVGVFKITGNPDYDTLLNMITERKH